MLDPFNQYGVGASLAKANLLRSEQMGNTVRYDSPVWSGFGFGATYTLGHNTKGDANVDYDRLGNDGFAVNLKYDNGPILLLANYDRMVDSYDSYTWNVGGAYSYAGFKVSLGYEDSRMKLFENDDPSVGRIKQQDWIVGLQYKTVLIRSVLPTIAVKLNSVAKAAKPTNTLWVIPTVCPNGLRSMPT